MMRDTCPERNGRLPDILDIVPKILPPLDPGFRPPVLAWRTYREEVRASRSPVQARIALERENELTAVFELSVFPEDLHKEATCRLVERTTKFLLWSRGGWKIVFQGPGPIAGILEQAYSAEGPHAFDAGLMARVYSRSFKVLTAESPNFPRETSDPFHIGGHTDGCRIGFDLGASDYKIAAVREGKAVFSEEIPWNPGEQSDPSYHENHIRSGLQKAAAALPRVDAVGGSAAGIYIDSRPRVASLFRSVGEADFENIIRPMFHKIRRDLKVPLVVVNDGEVTALAGRMALGEAGVLGCAMGSSLAGGYVDPGGRLTGWLNELAFAPVDLNPEAPRDEWSGDRGVGVNYFSQQAVDRLARRAGLVFPPDMRLPERLVQVQAMAEKGGEQADLVFSTIGVYLGYTLPYYREFYDFRNLLLLGRVMSGKGGEIILARARDILAAEFPETNRNIRLHLLDDKTRRVGQAVAAAGLPSLSRDADGKGDGS
jgi:predicted NBD/HSP70 family sugar kinase